MSVAHKRLTRVGQLIKQQQDLFQLADSSTTESAPPVKVTARMHKRVEAMSKAIEERNNQQQDRGFLSRPFALCNLPVRRKDTSVYERRNGKFTLRIEAGQGKDLPYGQDRLVLILLATLAVQRKSRSIDLGSAADIIRMFGLPVDGRSYRRLTEAFERIFSATIYWSAEGSAGGNTAKLVSKHKLSLLDSIHLWYDDEERVPKSTYHNYVVLSEQFYSELTAHPVPLNFTVVRELITAPAVLDFYVWIVYRAFTTPDGQTATVPLFGATGLQAQLGIHVRDPKKLRQTVRRMMAQVRGFWPEMPVTLSSDGDQLYIEHAVDLQQRLN